MVEQRTENPRAEGSSCLLYTSASAASGKVAAAQSQLFALEAANADYDELQERYAAFTVNSLSDVEKALADRGAILDLSLIHI